MPKSSVIMMNNFLVIFLKNQIGKLWTADWLRVSVNQVLSNQSRDEGGAGPCKYRVRVCPCLKC